MHYYVSNAKRTSYATSLCVCVCVFVFWFYRISRQIAPTMGTCNSLVRPVTSCFHLHLINTRSTKPTNFHRRQTWKIFSCFMADTKSWHSARVIKVSLMTFKPSIARKRIQRFTKSVQAVKEVAHNDSNIVHGVWDKGICLLNKKAKLIS